MIGKTIRQLFKAINEFNNALDVLNDSSKRLELRIYLDDIKIYEGTSYASLIDYIDEEYIEEFQNEFYNAIFCGNNAALINVNDYQHKVEVFVV